MARWEPDAAGRFRIAAMELFIERGYEQTTVADIAAQAGLTARTFFRHFTDKREVLFGGSQLLQQAMIDALEKAPADASPLQATELAVSATGSYFSENREFARQRDKVISANAELQERELIKLASLSAILAEGLRKRKVVAFEASLVAEIGIVIFRTTFATWIQEGERRSFSEIAHDAFDRLRKICVPF